MASAARKDFERRERFASASKRFFVSESIRTERVVVIGCSNLYTYSHNNVHPGRRFAQQAAPVFAQDCEQILAEHDIAILPALTTLHVDDAAGTVNVRDLQAGQLGAARRPGRNSPR